MFPTHVGIARNAGRPCIAGLHVPYACGDCADATSHEVEGFPCSLRMWGLRVITQDATSHEVMFPTHVGIARVPGIVRLRVDYVPYACGDCACVPLRVTSSATCSLRMWGLRDVVAGSMPSCRMFPTHVGIARQCRTVPPACAHVPYACGDCAFAGRIEAGRPACSLRMWGLRGSCRRNEWIFLMFPTHVGIARWMGRTRTPTLDMFPTHVGIARYLGGRQEERPNVPYACGDCAALIPEPTGA